jgi:hypothetical protein
MRVGIDFDNTVVIYDRLFHRVAVERFGMPTGVSADKGSVRAWFWSREDGNVPWTELQGIVYGTRLDEAEVAEGLLDFLHVCRSRDVEVAIVSHKTEFPALGARVNLREAARRFLTDKGLLDEAKTGLSEARVSFASTREEKIARIAAFAPDAFVDDLVEVFAEPAFPAGVRKMLYDPQRRPVELDGLAVFGSWGEVQATLFEEAT